MTKICYLGNFVPLESTETHIAATLEAMGHTVYRMQEHGCDWSAVSIVAERSDLFLWTTTQGQRAPDAFRTLRHLADCGIPSVSYHLDLFWGLEREAKVLEEPFFRTDWLFTADGGHDADWKREDINHVWLPPAIYAPNAVIGEPIADHQWPIVFVGSYPYPHPIHAPARRELIQILEQRYRRQFRVYRSGVRGQKLADLIAGTTIVVGDSCLAGQIPRYWSDRIPETIGRGGFLIHPYVPGLEECYSDGEHMRWYTAGAWGELWALVDHYLAHPAEAKAIGRAGREHVLAHHTYAHRMEQMLSTVLGAQTPRRVIEKEMARDGVQVA